eukprot:TRINITY_DN40597_c0_g1_i1.p1 TRINITY_DN40597_c0_g1~~TRINITY_DN40597_c0_g1_i1.p1  ORF type:complete len:1022 (-),score=192.21 TRINITY_DN40597_c0_g1_i1:184-3249(-)
MAAADFSVPVAWSEVFRSSEEPAATLQSVRKALESRWKAGKIGDGGTASVADARCLAQALDGAFKSKDPRKSLAASLAVLVIFEDCYFTSAAEIAAISDVHGGLCGMLTADSAPVIVAAAIRALSTLTAALASVSQSKEDRQTKPRKLVAQLRSAIDNHPKALLVQEAFAQGCCSMLGCEILSVGQQPAALWALLWPLAVHPHDDVATAAVACLCRLTGVSRGVARVGGGGFGGGDGSGPAGFAGSSGSAHHHVPDAEQAIVTACNEFEVLFRPLHAACRCVAASVSVESVSPRGAVVSSMAALQCVRLLELVSKLVVHGCSPIQAPGRNKDVSAAVPTTNAVGVVLPLTPIFRTIDLVISSTFHDAVSLAGSLTGTSRKPHGMAEILGQALELIAIVAGVAGAAMVTQVQRLRRWLSVFTDAPMAAHKRHGERISAVVLAVADATPAVLLKPALARRLVGHCLEAFKAAGEMCVDTADGRATATKTSSAGGSHGAASSAAAKRKRPYADTGDDKEGASSLSASGDLAKSSFAGVHLFRSACFTLERMLRLATPMLQPTQIASVCEQVIRVLWLGLVAPASGAGVLDVVTSREIIGQHSGSASTAGGNYRIICRDGPTVVALLGVIEALHGSATPLARGLVDAFAALLDTVALTYSRRSGARSHNGRGRSSSLDAAPLAGCAIRYRALHVRDAILASNRDRCASEEAAAAAPGSGAVASRPARGGDGVAITIEWPVLSPAASAEEVAVPGSKTIISEEVPLVDAMKRDVAEVIVEEPAQDVTMKIDAADAGSEEPVVHAAINTDAEAEPTDDALELQRMAADVEPVADVANSPQCSEVVTSDATTAAVAATVGRDHESETNSPPTIELTVADATTEEMCQVETVTTVVAAEEPGTCMTLAAPAEVSAKTNLDDEEVAEKTETGAEAGTAGGAMTPPETAWDPAETEEASTKAAVSEIMVVAAPVEIAEGGVVAEPLSTSVDEPVGTEIPGEAVLELFPGSDSPIPDLCMDSPSSDEAGCPL